MPHRILPFLACACALLLTACGGGGSCSLLAGPFLPAGCGGGGSSGSGPQQVSVPEFTPPPGAAPPVETGAEQTARAPAIVSRSDSFIVSDLYLETSHPDAPQARLRATCTGTTCFFREPESGFTERLSTADLTFRSADASEGILTRHGITLFVGADATGVSWGAWMRHATFQVTDGRGQQDGIRIEARGASVVGDRTGTQPATTATWHGVLVATPVHGSRKGNLLTGTARLTYAPRTATLDATFADIFDMTRGAAHDRLPGFINVAVRPDGTYAAGASGNRIQGGFYGPAHAESAGIVEQAGLVGAFGARQATP